MREKLNRWRFVLGLVAAMVVIAGAAVGIAQIAGSDGDHSSDRTGPTATASTAAPSKKYLAMAEDESGTIGLLDFEVSSNGVDGTFTWISWDDRGDQQHGEEPISHAGSTSELLLDGLRDPGDPPVQVLPGDTQLTITPAPSHVQETDWTIIGSKGEFDAKVAAHDAKFEDCRTRQQENAPCAGVGIG
ncbi:hypothetical protein [Actinomadura coerulea]|uniref:hypothetical protein n=1 Tax=Actinomadura coerulea TaxID=46159 RepID=UPI00343887ED